MSAYPVDLYPGCPCYRCDSPTWVGWSSRMTLCPTCGNKRCPGAADHDNECSGSNEPGQVGSRYPAPDLSDTRTPAQRINDFLNREAMS